MSSYNVQNLSHDTWENLLREIAKLFLPHFKRYRMTNLLIFQWFDTLYYITPIHFSKMPNRSLKVLFLLERGNSLFAGGRHPSFSIPLTIQIDSIHQEVKWGLQDVPCTPWEALDICTQTESTDHDFSNGTPKDFLNFLRRIDVTFTQLVGDPQYNDFIARWKIFFGICPPKLDESHLADPQYFIDLTNRGYQP